MNKKERKEWNRSKESLRERIDPKWDGSLMTYRQARGIDMNDIHRAMYEDFLAGKPLPEDLDELDWMNSNE